MATFSPLSARVSYKLDTGEKKEGKAVYKTRSITRINGEAGADAIGQFASAMGGFFRLPVDETLCTRVDRIEA